MQLNEFNLSSKDDAQKFLKNCVQIQSWAEVLLAQRPFDSAEALMAAAKQQVGTWTWPEVADALANHPRIGEKKAQAELNQTEQAFSDREQAAITVSQETQDALFKGNNDYEKKFGYIFLIKAAGLNSQDVLQALKYRLLNDKETEQCIVKHQLGEIALLRLSQEIQA